MTSAPVSVSRRIGRDAARVTVIGGLTRVAPLVSTIVVAAVFGTGEQIDVYFFTLVLPVFLAGMTGMAITSVFVPVLVEEEEKDPSGFPRLKASLFSYVSIVGFGLTVGYAVAAPAVVPALGGAFDEPGRRLAVDMSRILSPVIVLTVARSFLTAVCNARKLFLLPTIALTLTPVAMIVSLLYLHDSLGAYALPVGNVAGHTLEVLALAAGLGRAGALPGLTLHRHPRARRVFSLALPQVLSGSVLRLGPVIDRTMASLLTAGSISALVYAERLQSIPQQVLALGFFNVLLAHWSLEKLDAGMKSVGDSLVKIQKLMLTVVVPVASALWLFREPVTRALLERGALGNDGAGQIAAVVGVYALQIVPVLFKLVYVRVFLVMKETMFLMRMGFFTAGSRLALNGLFVVALGMDVRGIALATVLTSWASFVLFNLALRRRLGFFPFRPGRRETIVVAVSTTAAALASGAIRAPAESVYGVTAGLVLAAALFVSVYAFSLYAFRDRRYLELRRLVEGR